MHLRSRSVALAVAALLAGCTGNGGSSVPLGGAPVGSGGNSGNTTTAAATPTIALKSTIAVTGAPSSGFTYDLLYNDYASLGATKFSRLLYLADRSNKAVDVFNMDTLKLVGQIKSTMGGFAGVSPGGSSQSGPNGPVSIPTSPGTAQTLYVSDAGHKVHQFTVAAGGGSATENVVDVVPPAPDAAACPGYPSAVKIGTTATTYPGCAAPAPAGDAANRIDEGSYDVADDIVAYNIDADTTPATVFIKGSTGAILGESVFPQAGPGAGGGGTGYVAYDPSTKLIYAEISGSPNNPGGEFDVIDPKAVLAAGTTASGAQPNFVPVSKIIPIPAPCSAAGFAINSAGQALVGCDPSGQNGVPINTYLITLSTGAVAATLSGPTGTGGADQVAYMPSGAPQQSNRFYMANRRWVTSGFESTTFNPVLGVVGPTGNFIQNVPTSGGSHSVATDPVNGNIFVPFGNGNLAVFGT